MAAELVPKRPVGSAGLVASAQGLGCMGITAFYARPAGVTREQAVEEGVEAIGEALRLGVNFLDTAWIYQSVEDGQVYYNEDVVGKALKKFGRENFVVATKFGFRADFSLDSSEENICSQLAESLARLGTDYIDLYYQHRPDLNRPIEEVMTTLKALVSEGKIKYVGLSECTGDELRRAHAIHPVTAIQMEWSLQTRDIEESVVPTARELGVAIVAYSPLGRGFLSNTFTKIEDLPENDWRRALPRLSPENLADNVARLDKFKAKAAELGHTPAQLALAWVHAQGPDVFPIPGTRTAARVAENARASLVQLSPELVRELGEMVDVVGLRYTEAMMSITHGGRQNL